MTQKVAGKERELFELAFELAYFVHANKEIAFFIAEDALDSLSSLLGYQKKNRAPVERLRGFWKWGERSRPVRQTLLFDEYQMLQWLVYKHSEYWERQTEENRSFYTPLEEDLIVRYIEHLVFLTVRRGSFYTTLAVCSLLHQFDRRETRLFHDVLTQSDPARMKDTNYIGKQRIELMEKVFRRFDGVVRSAAKRGNDKQILMRAATQETTKLVNESLKRFTPWGTKCVIGNRFEVTDIPELYFSETNNEMTDDEENSIEMNRLHTVLDPGCLHRFVTGLAEYVSRLPNSDLDASCNFDLSARISLPNFINLNGGPPRDRFQTPSLRNEDYIRLRRTLDARGHRKRAFVPEQLSVYADDRLQYSFGPHEGQGECSIPVDTAVVEVRGKDSLGEVLLGMVPLAGLDPSTVDLKDSIVHAGGQKITLRITPSVNHHPQSGYFRLEIGYQPGGVIWKTFAKTKQWLGWILPVPNPQLASLGKASLAILLLSLSFLLVWRQHQTKIPQPTLLESATTPHHEDALEQERPPEATSSPLKKKSQLNIAQARWTMDREAVLGSIPVEATRAETRTISPKSRKTRVALNFPLYDSEGRQYLRYRIILSAGETLLWRKTAKAPNFSISGYGHVLDLVIFNQRLPRHKQYEIRIEGLSKGGWQSTGNLILKSLVF